MEKKLFIKDSLKGGIFAFVLSTIFVLVLALIAKLFTMSTTALPIINQILKAVAVIVATIICIKGEKKVLKCTISALLFVVLNIILFAILGGEFSIWQVVLDFAVSIVVAVVTAIIINKKTSR